MISKKNIERVLAQTTFSSLSNSHSNVVYQNILTSPQASLDSQNFIVTINGESIEYDQQILTTRGLEIYSESNPKTAPDEKSLEYILQLKDSLSYDRKYIENKYCIELAITLDRASNSAYQMVRKSKVNKNINGRQTNITYTLQICELIIKKIPLKAKCLQNVLRRIPLHKIQVLFENDSFFLELIKIICLILFKININMLTSSQKFVINNTENQDSEQSLSFNNENSDSGQEERKGEDLGGKKGKSKAKKCKKYQMTSYEQKVLGIFENIRNNLKKFNECYERINLILGMFTKQERLLAFFYDLNRQLICQQLTHNLSQIYESSTNVEKVSKRFNTAQANVNKLRSISQIEMLNKLIAITKTVILSAGKSQSSYKIIRGMILTEEYLVPWLKSSFDNIKISIEASSKFIEFIALIVEINPLFVASLYSLYSLDINHIINLQVKWIYLSLSTALPTPQEESQLQEKAIETLDHLIIICKVIIKQTTSSVNFGRAICKQICETATNLRPNDIQFLTYVCCINPFSRQAVMKYLFAYFRTFFETLRNSLKGCKAFISKTVRKNKHYLLEILQSIRKISQIDEIELTIDEELLVDIQMILGYYAYKFGIEASSGPQKGSNDCVYGAYLAMMKNIKIDPINQKDSSSLTYEFECAKAKKEQ